MDTALRTLEPDRAGPGVEQPERREHVEHGLVLLVQVVAPDERLVVEGSGVRFGFGGEAIGEAIGDAGEVGGVGRHLVLDVLEDVETLAGDGVVLSHEGLDLGAGLDQADLERSALFVDPVPLFEQLAGRTEPHQRRMVEPELLEGRTPRTGAGGNACRHGCTS